MTWDRLGGWYRIDEIEYATIEDEPGVYLFKKHIDGPIRYVGRSDTNLFNRIYGRDYVWFRCKHCSNDREAYYWECHYFHEYEDTIENINHPARPWGSSKSCHICGH